MSERTSGGVEIRPLRPDEIERFVGLSYYAFAGRAPREREADFGRRVLPERNVLVAVEDGQIISQVLIYEFGIWIDGVRYPTGGLANVATVPERTRQGHANRLLRASLAWMRDQLGLTLSTLDPTMPPLYKQLGWAYADDSYRLIGPPEAFRPSPLLPADPHGRIERRPASTDEIERLEPMYRAFARPRSGYLDRPRWYWEDYVLRQNDERSRWLATWQGADGRLGGYVVYTLVERPERLARVYEVVALRPEAYHGLLTFLATHHLWNKVSIPVGRDVPWRAMLAAPERLEGEIDGQHDFMLRLVDLPRAFAQRVPRTTQSAGVVLQVRDAAAPWNDGTWHVSQCDGRWSVGEAGPREPDASADVATLSALFDGFLTVDQAIASGALRAASDAVPILQSLFATDYPPTSRDHF
jgi:predicted acetyltransferase